MKLLISVINRDDTYSLLDELVHEGYDATIVSTTGGFLREGNATLLIGVADESVSHVLEIIKTSCRARVRYVTPVPLVTEFEEMYNLAPIEVEVGGAIIFILDIERFERF